MFPKLFQLLGSIHPMGHGHHKQQKRKTFDDLLIQCPKMAQNFFTGFSVRQRCQDRMQFLQFSRAIKNESEPDPKNLQQKSERFFGRGVGGRWRSECFVSRHI